MARVLSKKRTSGGNKTYTCIRCREEITPGQRYSEVTLYKQPSKRIHKKCGGFLPSELSSSKMARVDEAVAGADFSSCESIEDLESVLETVAEVADEVAAEYTESAESIGEHFPGSPTAEACESAASDLESWAEDLRNWEPEEFDGDPLNQEAAREWFETQREAASEKLGDQPSYNG